MKREVGNIDNVAVRRLVMKLLKLLKVVTSSYDVKHFDQLRIYLQS